MPEPSRSSPAAGGPPADSFGPDGKTLSREDVPSTGPTLTQRADSQFLSAPHAGEVGTFGRYRVLKKLGQGGMGAVFLASDSALDRNVALKVLLPKFAADAGAKERFLREARTAAMVRSDHVVTIFDVGEERDTPFIAMEYLLGYPLDRYLKQKGELPLAQVLRVTRETALGLAAAHELGLIHRDIKPANLWLETPRGRVKLLDFGLARAEDDDTQLTGSGAVMGTPAYMSPEQGRGLKLDHRSDLFSVGVLLYRLCTGKMPFSGNTTMAVLTSLAVDTPAPIRELNPNVPVELEALVTKLLAKNPAHRFQSANEIADALRDIEAPRSTTGAMPVVVAIPLPDTGHAQNVWDGIDESQSVPVAVAADTDAEAETKLGSKEIEPEPEPVPKRKNPAARKKPVPKSALVPAVLAVLGLFAAVAVLAAILLWPSNGTLIVESDDADAEIVVKRDGEIVRDRTKDREFALRTGAYTIELADPKPGLKLNADKFEITKEGTSRVRLIADKPKGPGGKPQLQPPPPPPLPPPTPTVDRQAAELVISLGGYVRLHTNDRGNGRGYRDVAALPAGNLSLAQVHIDSREKPRVLADAVLEKFKECKALTHLILQGCAVTDTGLAHLAGCPQLKELALYGPKVTDAGLAHFKGCAQLERLDLEKTSANDAGLAHFKGCTNLKSLRLAGMKVSATGLAHFKDCLQLESISLEGTPLPVADLAALGGRPELKELDLSGTGVGDGALPHFKSCSALRVVNLANTAVTDDVLAFFEGSASLRELNLSNTTVTGTGLARLAGCPRLGILQLAGAKQLTNDALAPLKECPDLYSLNLLGTPITNDALKHIEVLGGLQVLQLRGTKVSKDAARKLAEKLPGCRIESDGGVSQPVPDPDRAAAEGLLGVGIWSIFVNGKEVQGFAGPETFPRDRFEMRSLYVNRNAAVTDDSFKCLAGCRHLTVVQITNVNITDQTLTYLKDSNSTVTDFLTDARHPLS